MMAALALPPTKYQKIRIMQLLATTFHQIVPYGYQFLCWLNITNKIVVKVKSFSICEILQHYGIHDFSVLILKSTGAALSLGMRLKPRKICLCVYLR